MKNIDRGELNILHTIFTQNIPTRNSISRKVNLSLLKVSSILKILEDRGLIIKAGKTRTKSGRPSYIYSLRSDFGYSAGISLGLDSFRIVFVNSAKEVIYNEVFPLCIPTHPDNHGNSIVGQITDVLQDILDKKPDNKQLLALGFALPGMVNKRSGTWFRGLQISGINNMPVSDIFLDRFHLPVFADDMSRTLTCWEMYKGNGKGVADFVLLYVGIGLGAGIVIGEKVFYGSHGLGGEIGHIQHVKNKYRCSCGSIGCLETVLSEPGILRIFRERLKEGVISYLQRYTYENMEALTLEKILIAAEHDDRLSLTVLHEIGEYLGDACAILIKLYDPKKLIISGAVAMFKEYLKESVDQVVMQRVLPEMLEGFEIVFSEYRPDQEAIGAALCAVEYVLSKNNPEPLK